MTSRPLNILNLIGDDPLSIGHQHGEHFRDNIAEIAEIRLERMCAIPPHRRIKDILALASEHIPILLQFDDDLFLELRGISEASSVSLERLIVLNHYTDLRDIPQKPGAIVQRSGKEDNGGCSIIYSPTNSGPILGQTWDIHGSAEPYVILLKFKDQLLFSITGCLGMTGLNQNGVGIAINNLTSIDAKIGIVWPALIRKALKQQTAVLAKDEIMKAPLGSGRHFAIADKDHFFSIEASGTKKKIVWEKTDELYFHTNHCLDEEMRKTHIILNESTSLWRYQELDEVVRYDDLSSLDNVFLALAKVSLPQDKNEPHKTATCGTFVMDISQRQVLACQGIASKELLQWPSIRIQII